MQNKNNRGDKKLILAAAACAGAGAIAGVMFSPATSVLGMVAMGAVGAVSGGVILPVAGIGLFFGGKALMHFAQNDGAKIAVLGLLLGLGIAKALFVTPVQAAKEKIGSFFSKKKKQQPPSPAVHSAKDATLSPLKDQSAQAEFNAAGVQSPDAVKPALPATREKHKSHRPS